MANVRDEFEIGLKARFPEVQIHCAGVQRLSNTSCFSLPGVVGEELATALAAQGIIVGVGSACSSGALHPPKTLLAMNVDYTLARAALRVSLSTSTSSEQTAILLNHLADLLEKSPSLTGLH
jgi:cysteine desulfurase